MLLELSNGKFGRNIIPQKAGHSDAVWKGMCIPIRKYQLLLTLDGCVVKEEALTSHFRFFALCLF
jgi:hypothetical protein